MQMFTHHSSNNSYNSYFANNYPQHQTQNSAVSFFNASPSPDYVLPSWTTSNSPQQNYSEISAPQTYPFRNADYTSASNHHQQFCYNNNDNYNSSSTTNTSSSTKQQLAMKILEKRRRQQSLPTSTANNSKTKKMAKKSPKKCRLLTIAPLLVEDFMTPEQETSNYSAVLQVPVSKDERDKRTNCRLGYANRNQPYWLSLNRRRQPHENPPSTKSIITLSLSKNGHHEAKYWNHWYFNQTSKSDRQPRAIDVDRQICRQFNVAAESVVNIALNAVSIGWPATNDSFKVHLKLGCLSTDFCLQRGVKGLTLRLLVDTYENEVHSHRCYALLKTFSDKGAERKLRDECKRRQRKQQHQQLDDRTKEQQQQLLSFYYFYNSTINDFTTQPFYFNGFAQDDKLMMMMMEMPKHRAVVTPVVFYVRSKDEQTASPVELMPWQCNSEEDLKQALIQHYYLQAGCFRNVTIRLNNGTSTISPSSMHNAIFFVHYEQIINDDPPLQHQLNTTVFDLHLIQLAAATLPPPSSSSPTNDNDYF